MNQAPYPRWRGCEVFNKVGVMVWISYLATIHYSSRPTRNKTLLLVTLRLGLAMWLTLTNGALLTMMQMETESSNCLHDLAWLLYPGDPLWEIMACLAPAPSLPESLNKHVQQTCRNLRPRFKPIHMQPGAQWNTAYINWTAVNTRTFGQENAYFCNHWVLSNLLRSIIMAVVD